MYIICVNRYNLYCTYLIKINVKIVFIAISIPGKNDRILLNTIADFTCPIGLYLVWIRMLLLSVVMVMMMTMMVVVMVSMLWLFWLGRQLRFISSRNVIHLR